MIQALTNKGLAEGEPFIGTIHIHTK